MRGPRLRGRPPWPPAAARKGVNPSPRTPRPAPASARPDPGVIRPDPPAWSPRNGARRGQRDVRREPSPGRLLQPDPPGLRLHQGPGDGQPEAGATSTIPGPSRVGPEEPLERGGPVPVRHPASVVLDGDDGLLPPLAPPHGGPPSAVDRDVLEHRVQGS